MICEIVEKYEIDMTMRPHILVGKDTRYFFLLFWFLYFILVTHEKSELSQKNVFVFYRPSSPSLAKSLMDGILALTGKPIDYGIVTTPQLHYFVKCRNSYESYGAATEEGYYKKLTSAFKRLRGNSPDTNGNYTNTLLYDGANGVGAKKIKFFQELLKDVLKIEMYNDEGIGTGKLNYMVCFH